MRRGAWSLFEAGIEACSVAIAKRRLGIADLVLCAIPDVVTLDARRRGDAARTRRSFDLHRDFGPALRAAQRTHIAGIAIDGLRRRD